VRIVVFILTPSDPSQLQSEKLLYTFFEKDCKTHADILSFGLNPVKKQSPTPKISDYPEELPPKPAEIVDERRKFWQSGDFGVDFKRQKLVPDTEKEPPAQQVPSYLPPLPTLQFHQYEHHPHDPLAQVVPSGLAPAKNVEAAPCVPNVESPRVPYEFPTFFSNPFLLSASQEQFLMRCLVNMNHTGLSLNTIPTVPCMPEEHQTWNFDVNSLELLNDPLLPA